MTEARGPYADLIDRITSSPTVWPPNPLGIKGVQIPIAYQVPGETVQEIIDILQGAPEPGYVLETVIGAERAGFEEVRLPVRKLRWLLGAHPEEPK